MIDNHLCTSDIIATTCSYYCGEKAITVITKFVLACMLGNKNDPHAFHHLSPNSALAEESGSGDSGDI